MQLREEFEALLNQRELTTDSRAYQDAMETAITILVQAGHQDTDMDEMGDEMGDIVQTHLMLAMLRDTQLERTLFAAIHDHISEVAKAEMKINHRSVACPNSGGAGSVPMGGGEDPADVDNGYVRCPECNPAPESYTPRHRMEV